MAVLSSEQRAKIRSRMAQRLSAANEACGLTRADFLAAVNATDQWIDDNAATYNSAIPQPARGVLTAAQKAELFSIVALARFSPL